MAEDTVVITRGAQKYRTLVTDIGNAKIAKAALIGEKVNVIEAAVGDGGGAYYVPTADMAALKNEKWRGPIQAKAINPDSKNMVDVKFRLDGTVGGFTIREAGLFDEDGDLIAVCNMPDTEKAVILDGISSTLTILMHTIITNIDAVEFKVDTRVDVVTQAELEQAIETAVRPLVQREEMEETLESFVQREEMEEALGQRLEPLEPYYALIQIPHGLGAYPQVLLGQLQHGLGLGALGDNPIGASDVTQLPVRAVYHDSQSLTVQTVQSIVQLGAEPELQQRNAREYFLTWPNNQLDNLYIRLI